MVGGESARMTIVGGFEEWRNAVAEDAARIYPRGIFGVEGDVGV